MKPNPTNQSSDAPVNVIFLEKSIFESKEEIIESHIELLKDCVKAQDFYALFDIFFDEVAQRTGKWIIERQIQDKAKILDEINKI